MQKKFLDSHWLTFIGFILVILFLTPRGWEITGETWKAWKCARILQETGEHSAFSMGPLYYTYLIFFKLFPYPFSINLEFIVTHLFALTGLFCLLRSKFKKSWAWWLLIAWYPYLAMFESTKYVAGAGLLALHFSLHENHPYKRGLIPPWLALAVLCNQGYLFFWIGHILGEIISLIAKKTTIQFKFNKILIVKLFIVLFISWVAVKQSPRPDNNPFMLDSKYYPVPVKSHLNAAFFQMGNFRYVTQHYPESVWMEKDWYLTNTEAFGGAQSILEAIKLAPANVINNFKLNLSDAKNLPPFLIFGMSALSVPTKEFIIFKLMAILFWIIAITYLFYKNFKQREFSTILSLSLGSMSLLTAMMLTWFNIRYMVQLLPVIFLLFLYFYDLTKDLKVDRPLNLVSKAFKVFGVVSFFLGFVLSPWYFAQAGLLLLLVLSIKKRGQLFKDLAVIYLSVIIFTSCNWPNGLKDHLSKTFNFNYFLASDSVVSFNRAYSQIFKELEGKNKILSNDSIWMQSFAPVEMNKFTNPMEFPPLPTKDEENLLTSFDAIFINQSWETQKYAVATQEGLRYQKFVRPYLESHPTIKCKPIEHYGKVCY